MLHSSECILWLGHLTKSNNLLLSGDFFFPISQLGTVITNSSSSTVFFFSNLDNVARICMNVHAYVLFFHFDNAKFLMHDKDHEQSMKFSVFCLSCVTLCS